MEKAELKYRVWITSKTDDWYGCDNYDEFDWDNRMRDVFAIYFPLGQFSGKDISLKEIECEGEDNYANGWTSINDCELMQFIGLKDCNDKDIYEGDVIEFRANYSSKPCGQMKAKVVIGVYHLELHAENGLVYNAEEEADEFPYQHCEIIGNIYENPEIINN